MAGTTEPRSPIGAWIIAASAAVATAVALYNDLTRGTGVDHTYGALLVVISSALILLASLLLAVLPSPRWLRGVLNVLLFLGIIGTSCAAYFLEAPVLLALMILALFGWLIQVMRASEGSQTQSQPVQSRAARS